MVKKFTAVFLSMLFMLGMFGVLNASAAADFEVGDEVKLIFTIGKLQNVAGVSVSAGYNAEFLKASESECSVSGSMINIANQGEIKWNFIVFDGMNFDNDDVTVVTFEVIKPCSFADIGIGYNCSEVFDSNAKKLDVDYNTAVTARLNHNGEEFAVKAVGSASDSGNDVTDSDSDTDIQKLISNTDTHSSFESESSVSRKSSSSVGSSVASSKASSQDSTSVQNSPVASVVESSVDTSGSFAEKTALLSAVLVVCGLAVIVLKEKSCIH